jgi:hypothetical protein
MPLTGDAGNVCTHFSIVTTGEGIATLLANLDMLANILHREWRGPAPHAQQRIIKP